MDETDRAAVKPRKPSGAARLVRGVFFVLLVALIAGAIVSGIRTRVKAAAMVRLETLDLAVPTVAIIHPKRGAMNDEVVLPGNIQAFTDSPIYARTNGYLKKWYSDIGARVKTGQLLAEIEAPEVDKQLEQARADVGTAETNAKMSDLTATRYLALLKMDAISRQDADLAVSDFQAKKTMLESARANVKRLEDMVAFQKIYAPFDGVITARKTDVGALVNAGNGGAAQELFHLAATDKLRVFVSLPQIYSRSAVPGVTADLTLAEFPGPRFPAQLARTAESIDPASRTLLVEFDVDNASGQLLPGAYAQVHLKLGMKTVAFVLPVTALIFRSEGLQVGVVRNGKAELIRITQGKDYGSEVEVTSGIAAGDDIIANPPDSLTSGMAVRVAPEKN